MDIGKLTTTERICEIKHPVTGDDLGIKVIMVSIDDPRMKKLKREIANRSQQLQMRNKAFTAEDLEKNFRRVVFTALVGWDWYGEVEFDGRKPAFNEHEFNAICDRLPWFQQQLEERLDEKASFISA